MKIKQFLTEERAVSPVIGVILMVAITVILAAVIGTFVLGLGQNVNSTPQASFSFDFDTSNTSVDATHTGGDKLDSDNTQSLEIKAAGNNGSFTLPVTAGDNSSIISYGSGGNTVRVIYTGPEGTSATLASTTAPS